MSSPVTEALKTLVEGADLSAGLMRECMQQIMSGAAGPGSMGAFLVALRMKGETVSEIATAAQVMRELATPIDTTGLGALIDLVGTGGDGASLFNVSTASSFVVAAGGGCVAKHGNRSVSSACGAADVLELAGAKLDLSPDAASRLLRESRFAFLFAPSFHLAMKHAIGIRRELGLRTVFNLLGPLSNPAGAQHALIGVYAQRWVRPVAEVLRELGAKHVLVVHSGDGLDELSIAAPAFAAELRDGEVHTLEIDPDHLGIRIGSLDALKVSDAAGSLKLVEAVLRGIDRGPAHEMIALNAGAALYVADLQPSLKHGVAQARDILKSGLAWERLQSYVAASQR